MIRFNQLSKLLRQKERSTSGYRFYYYVFCHSVFWWAWICWSSSVGWNGDTSDAHINTRKLCLGCEFCQKRWKQNNRCILMPLYQYSFNTTVLITYSVGPKNPPPAVFRNFFPNGWEFLINFFTHLLDDHFYTQEYKFLFKYLQRWQSYAILSATT